MAVKPKNTNYLDFFETVGRSKRLQRTGWVEIGKIRNPESVAEHSFGVGVLAMVLSDSLGINLDKDKLIKMSLLHDLGELVTGDVITERKGILDIKKRDEKEEEEEKGIRKIFDKIGAGEEYGAIFEEMIERVTPEAKVFWQFDKLEMALQALEYEKEQGKNLDEFFETSSLHIKEPLLQKIFKSILARRPKKKGQNL